MNIEVKQAVTAAEQDLAFAMRREVFVLEQNCPAALEFEHDNIAIHFLARAAGQPAGAARWRQTEKGYKLERFAVLKKYRGMGIAAALIKAVLESLPEDASYVYLHAQTSAVPVYAKAGFEIEGPEFEEAGIRHYKMVLKQTDNSYN